jgi:hypothetical protein
MSTIIATIIAFVLSCGAPPDPHEPPDDVKPPPDLVEENGQYFCCSSLGGNGSGNGCITIDASHQSACTMVLYCGGTFENNNGHVTCIN